MQCVVYFFNQFLSRKYRNKYYYFKETASNSELKI